MKCSVCNSPNTENIYKNTNAFSSHASLSFKLMISLCVDCGFIFQSGAYSDRYEEIISKVYREYRKKNDNFPFPRRCPDYLDTLKMITGNLPKGKNLNILEIGSNRGDMLYLIKERLPGANIVGIEPARFEKLAVPTINAFFSPELFSNKFDLIIMQHVLEHIKSPCDFINNVRKVLSNKGVIYIEVPNVENNLKYATEDFILDHVNYFSFSSLNRLMQGYKIIKVNTFPFLRIIAKKSKERRVKLSVKKSVGDIRKLFNNFKKNKEELVREIKHFSRDGKKIVFYGVSAYFRILFKELEGVINRKNCFYYDDNFKGDFEDTFKLPRLEKFNSYAVVILCSNVYRVQETMEKKLKVHKGISIIKPWSGMSRIIK